MVKILVETYRNGRIKLPPIFEKPENLGYDWRKGDWELFEGKTVEEAMINATKAGLREEHKKYGERASHYEGNPKSEIVSRSDGSVIEEVDCPLC